MSKLVSVLLCAFLCVQVWGDELDDLRAEYVGYLTDVHKKTGRDVESSKKLLADTSLYMDHAKDTFTTNEIDQTTEKLTSLNVTAYNLTVDATIHNKPVSVITCISENRSKGQINLEGLLPPFLSNLEKAFVDSTAQFSKYGDTISILEQSMQPLFDSNAEKLNTCVVEACFVTNLDAAKVQYGNLSNNLKSVDGEVKTARTDFNRVAIDILEDHRTDSQKALDNALTAMGKC